MASPISRESLTRDSVPPQKGHFIATPPQAWYNLVSLYHVPQGIGSLQAVRTCRAHGFIQAEAFGAYLTNITGAQARAFAPISVPIRAMPWPFAAGATCRLSAFAVLQ